MCQQHWRWLCLVLILQILVILTLPLAGDEAYFVAWGQQLSWIYYDHPPLTGWVSWLISQVSSSGYGHRVFSLLLGLLTCLMIFRFLVLRYDIDKANAFAPLILSLPITLLLFSLFVNDSLLFAALALFFVASFLSLQNRNSDGKGSWKYAVMAGFGLGLATLVKFTALVYFAAIGVFLLISPRHYRFLFGQYVVVGLTAFILFLFTLIPNYYNCGINLAFNFVFRDSTASLTGLWQFLGSLLLLMGPVIFFWKPVVLLKNFREEQYFFSAAFVVTALLLALIAFNRGEFGLHWAAPITMLGLLATAEQLVERREGLLLRLNLAYSSIIIVPIAIGLFLVTQGSSLVLDYFDDTSRYRAKQINDIRNGSLLAEIEKRFPGVLLVTDSYGLVSMFESKNAEAAMMFNDNSVFGRNHDIFRDYREYDDRDILFLSTEFVDGDGDLERHAEVFEEASILRVTGQQGDYEVVYGKGFDYERYRENYISVTFEKLYDQIPPLYGACYMDRYR